MATKLTLWFPADVKPVHVGVYEVIDTTTARGEFRYWNGTSFGLLGYTVEDAFDRRRSPGGFTAIKWRGLAEKPV